MEPRSQFIKKIVAGGIAASAFPHLILGKESVNAYNALIGNGSMGANQIPNFDEVTLALCRIISGNFDKSAPINNDHRVKALNMMVKMNAAACKSLMPEIPDLIQKAWSENMDKNGKSIYESTEDKIRNDIDIVTKCLIDQIHRFHKNDETIIRDLIVCIAKIEARPLHNGTVNSVVQVLNDQGKVITDRRFGWKRLMKYYDVDPPRQQTIKPESLQNRNKNPEFKTLAPPGANNWCGVFATWVWMKAGVDVYWGLGIGKVVGYRPVAGVPNKPAAKQPDPKTLNDGVIKVGDICQKQNSNSHLFIVTGVEKQGVKVTKVYTVDGNSDYKSVVQKVYNVSELGSFYSRSDFTMK